MLLLSPVNDIYKVRADDQWFLKSTIQLVLVSFLYPLRVNLSGNAYGFGFFFRLLKITTIVALPVNLVSTGLKGKIVRAVAR